MKKILLITFMILMGLPSMCAPGTSVTYVIDAEKNAYEHNNLGIMYVEEKDYYAAIQEFKIAISLNPKTQATAIYFNNLGKVYITIGYLDLALDCFQNAITQYNLNFEYYKNLVECYRTLNQIQTKLDEYKLKQNTPYDKIILGLLYEQAGDIRKAIFVLDEFVSAEPNLLITPAVKGYIQDLVNKLLVLE
jgi:tetratricopeptide (TPR) repeat protein